MSCKQDDYNVKIVSKKFMNDFKQDKNIIFTPNKQELSTKKIQFSDSSSSGAILQASNFDTFECADYTEMIAIPPIPSNKNTDKQSAKWRETYFPNYPLRKRKAVTVPNTGRKTGYEYSLGKKVLASLQNSELTDSTEIESDFDPNSIGLSKVAHEVQTDWKISNNKLKLEITFQGETLLKKDRKLTLVTLPHNYIEIGFRADANKNDEFANIVRKKYDKNRVTTGAKKKKEEPKEQKPPQSKSIISTTEIFPFMSERKIKYLNYNANIEKAKVLQRNNKKTISTPPEESKYTPQTSSEDIDISRGQKKILLIPVTEADLEEMDVIIPPDPNKPPYMNPKPMLSISAPVYK